MLYLEKIIKVLKSLFSKNNKHILVNEYEKKRSEDREFQELKSRIDAEREQFNNEVLNCPERLAAFQELSKIVGEMNEF